MIQLRSRVMLKDENTKVMDPKDFADEGYLQEVNRQFFHPLGLALFMEKDTKTGKYSLGVLDVRHDESGCTFYYYDKDPVFKERAKKIRIEQLRRRGVRLQKYNFWVQGVPMSKSQCSRWAIETEAELKNLLGEEQSHANKEDGGQ